MEQGSHSHRIARDSLRNYKNHAHFPGQKWAFTHILISQNVSVQSRARHCSIDPLAILQGSKLSNNFQLKTRF